MHQFGVLSTQSALSLTHIQASTWAFTHTHIHRVTLWFHLHRCKCRKTPVFCLRFLQPSGLLLWEVLLGQRERRLSLAQQINCSSNSIHFVNSSTHHRDLSSTQVGSFGKCSSELSSLGYCVSSLYCMHTAVRGSHLNLIYNLGNILRRCKTWSKLFIGCNWV